MKHAWLFAPLIAFALSGCGASLSAFDPILQPTDYVKAYQVFAIVTDQKQFAIDQDICAPKAAALPTGIDPGMTTVDTINGGLANATSAAIAPSAVAIGAAGAGTSDILKGLGLATPQKIHALILCMQELTHRDLSGVVMDPN